MKIAFFVNGVETEEPVYTTSRLALTALRREHEVFYVGAADLGLRPDGMPYAVAASAPDRSFRSTDTFLTGVREAERQEILLQDLDVFWLRNDPAEDVAERRWASTVGLDFGLLLSDRGTLVLNDPGGLAKASNKMYLQSFPESVRPYTLVTREVGRVRSFLEEQGSDVVLKPLQGSGGDRVFLVRSDDAANLNQIFETVAASGYVVVQEFLPAAQEGDIRMFLMNGRPLEVEGRIAAMKRVHADQDLRNNMSVGGRAEKAEVTPRMLELAEAVRPKLIEDGMFLVGLDIAGDHILEINVFSPGGLGGCEKLEEVDFVTSVIRAVEAKVDVMNAYARAFPNVRLNTL